MTKKRQEKWRANERVRTTKIRRRSCRKHAISIPFLLLSLSLPLQLSSLKWSRLKLVSCSKGPLRLQLIFYADWFVFLFQIGPRQNDQLKEQDQNPMHMGLWTGGMEVVVEEDHQPSLFQSCQRRRSIHERHGAENLSIVIHSRARTQNKERQNSTKTKAARKEKNAWISTLFFKRMS